jgi:peroxiredoxin
MHGLILTLAVSFAATAALAADENPPTLALGAAAPDFSLPGVDGKTYALKDFAAAKVLVLNFTCTHCPTAQAYEERVKRIVDDYGGKGVAVVAISCSSQQGLRLDELGWSDLDDSFESMKIRARDHEFNFPYLYDGDELQAVSRAYGPVATPHAFVFDAERKLRYVGRIDDDERGRNVKVRYVRDAIDALLAGRDPAVPSTRPVGCSTKWATKAPQVRAYMERLAAEPVSLDPAGEAELKELRENKSGKLRLVNFWATWCPPCIVEFPELVTINRMYRHRDFELVSVSVDKPEESEKALAFLKKQQASNRNLIFASGDRDRLGDAFEKEWRGQVPYTVLLAPGGEVLFRQTDRIEPLELRRAILKELNARRPW